MHLFPFYIVELFDYLFRIMPRNYGEIDEIRPIILKHFEITGNQFHHCPVCLIRDYKNEDRKRHLIKI